MSKYKFTDCVDVIENKLRKLGDFVTIKTGKLDANAAVENGKYPFFTCAVEQFKIDVYEYDCECVLVAGNGNLNVKYYNGKFNAYQRTYIIESINKNVLNVLYLYFFMSKYIEILRRESIGGVIKYIKLENLINAPIPIPDLSVQKSIVNKLQILDRIISLSKDIIFKLDNLVKARFIEMFGSIENNFYNYQTALLKEVCDKITDGTHKTPNYQSQGITFISAKNIIDGKLDFNDIKFITNNEYQKIQNRCQTELYDILMSKSGTLGTVALINTNIPLGLFESLAIIKYKRNLLSGNFLYEQLRSSSIQNQLLNKVKGIAIKHLHLNVIGEIKIILPPIELQNKFADFTIKVYELKSIVKKCLEKAELLKSSLTQEYFS